jgi:hypothetical protein
MSLTTSPHILSLLSLSLSNLVICERVAGQWGREHESLGSHGVGSRYLATTGQNTADWKDFVCAVVNCRVCELALALWLFVVTFCKSWINPITNLNPVYNHTHTRDNIYLAFSTKLSICLLVWTLWLRCFTLKLCIPKHVRRNSKSRNLTFSFLWFFCNFYPYLKPRHLINYNTVQFSYLRIHFLCFRSVI